MKPGWECPRCHKVWGPQIARCGCAPLPAGIPHIGSPLPAHARYFWAGSLADEGLGG